jgi:threonine dehydrogenase-like Zn-dependent dehydrogenase
MHGNNYDVGDQVSRFKVGDKVVVSAVISCGNCIFCKTGLVSCCDTTNPSKEMERLYGHKISGIFGYSHLTGGYDGGQAEFIRVPLADYNLLKVPAGLRDEQVIFLSDIVSTGWHANVLGCVNEGHVVVIWGCGPVGLMAAMWAKFRKAARIVMVDGDKFRLQFARDKLGVETIDFNDGKVTELIFSLVGKNGPDITIDCVGFRYPKSVAHQVQKTLKLETDVPEVLTEAIMACRKGGNLVAIGDYFEFSNNFPIGPLMEKCITFRGGQVCVQSYWKELLGYIEKGFVDPTFIITHVFPLDRAEEAYKVFDEHKDNVIKVLLKPALATAQQ